MTDETNIQLNDTKKTTTSVAQTKSSTKTKEEEGKDGNKGPNDCPINEDKQGGITSHVQ